MAETIGLIAIALSMLAIVAFMFRDLRSPAGTAGGLFAGYGDAGSLGGFLGGFVASVAAATAYAMTGAGAAGATSIGAVLGFTYVVLTGLRNTIGIRVVSGAVGTAGFLALVAVVISGSGCGGVPLWQRLVMIGLVLVAGGLGAVGSQLVGRPRLPSALAAFGALKTAAFLSAPLGVSLLSLPIAGWVVAFTAAVLLGGLCAIAPQFVVGLTTGVIAIGSLMAGTVYGNGCAAGADYTDLSAPVAFAAVYLPLRLLLGRLPRH